MKTTKKHPPVNRKLPPITVSPSKTAFNVNNHKTKNAIPTGTRILNFISKNVEILITDVTESPLEITIYEAKESSLKIINQYNASVKFHSCRENKMSLTATDPFGVSININLLFKWNTKPAYQRVHNIPKPINNNNIQLPLDNKNTAASNYKIDSKALKQLLDKNSFMNNTNNEDEEEVDDDSKIKSFTLTIKNAQGLKPDQFGSADAFCEIYFQNHLIGKTVEKKGTLNPIWLENFDIPYNGKKSPLIIEVYNFTFMGKGLFLGHIEIPFEELTNPPFPNGEAHLPLQKKLVSN